MISEHHLREWVEGSGVSEQITLANVQTLTDKLEIDRALERNLDRRWKHTDWGEGGWWVSGVDPATGEKRGIGGQFKPDKSPDPDRKYFGISGTETSPLFLDTGDRHYWRMVRDGLPMRPIIITEGAKKAGAGITAGYPTISIPGVTTGQKLGRLKEDLAQFLNVGRRVYLCFDSDVMQKPQVMQALDRLGRLIAECGANLSVIQLPETHKGMDDFLVANGKEAFSQLVETALTFEEWRAAVLMAWERPKTRKQQHLEAIRKLFGNRLKLNVMTKQVELDGHALKPDYLYMELLEKGIDSGKEFVMDAFYYLAEKNQYHPVRDYLTECKNKYEQTTLPMLEKVAATYLGTTEPIFDVFVRKTLIAAVARAFQPGCKVDTALFLQGTQGKRKSMFYKVLAGEQWFDDSLSNTSDKDEKLKLHSTWITEWAELEAIFSRKDVSSVKAFLSSSVDKFRAPFGKTTESYPRHSIIVGTTNTDDFLQDATGSRRFWVVPIPDGVEIQIEKLQEDRDRLWAAAVAAYESGEQWWLNKEQEAMSQEINRQFQRDDSWTEAIAKHIEFSESVTVKEILDNALHIEIGKQDRASQMRVADILRSLGWVKSHTKYGKIWKKKEDEGSHLVTNQTQSGLQGDYLMTTYPEINKGSHQNDDYLPSDPSQPMTTVKREVVTTENGTTQGFECSGDYVTQKSTQNQEILKEQNFVPTCWVWFEKKDAWYPAQYLREDKMKLAPDGKGLELQHRVLLENGKRVSVFDRYLKREAIANAV